MKNQSRVSIVLALSLFMSMLSFPSSTQAQPRPNRLRADTGVIPLGMGQVLRITVNGADGADAIRVHFAWMKYMAAGCSNEGVCRHTVDSQGATVPVILASNEAASFEVQGTGNGVRVMIRVDVANMRDAAGVRASGDIINSVTGAVVCHISWVDTELFT